MSRTAFFAAGLAMLTALSTGASGGRCLSISVSPTRAFAGTKLWVYTRVESARDHRAIEVIAESEDFYRGSEIALDGGRAPRTNTFEFRGLPAGDYAVRAVLKGVDGRELEVAEEKVTLFEDAVRSDR